MADLARIKRNVAKMVSMNAPESDIDAYIAQEGVTIDQIRAFRPSQLGASQTTGSTTVLSQQPQPTLPQDIKREAKIQAQGLAAGVGSFPGFVADVASVPTRTAGGLMAIAGDVTGTPSLRKKGEELFFYPSFAQKSADVVGSAVGRAINAPTDLTAGEKARQKGAEFVGGLAGGGIARKGVQGLAKAAEAGIPRVAQALRGVADSRAAKLVAPSRPADFAAAYGAGAGSEYAQQYAGENPALQAGAALAGGLSGGLAAGGLARMGGRGVQMATTSIRPNTGVGQSLIGPEGKINVERQFGNLAGTLRRAAANAETQLNSKFKTARELSAASAITPQGVAELRGRIQALALGTAEQNQKQLHLNVLSNLDQMIADRNGVLKIDDVAENIRRQYSNAGGSLAFAKGEGVRAVDSFLVDSVDNPALVNGVGKKASKAWKDAIGFAREKYQKFDDPNDIATIIKEEAGTGRPITPAQVGDIFMPSAKGSNLINKWEATLNAIPSGDRKFMNQTIKSGIFHNILKNSQESTPYGLQINEGKLADGLRNLIQDSAFKRKFTAAEQQAIMRVQASLTGARLTTKRLPQLAGAAIYALTGQGYGATRLGGEAAIGPAMADLSDIMKMLEKPLPLRRAETNFVGSVVVPTVSRQVVPAEQPQPEQQPVIGPQSSIQQPSRRLSYAEAKKQKGIA